jgi:hypothetical protein
MAQVDDTLKRLTEQLEWYSGKSKTSQNWFKFLKILEIIAAALIPFFAGMNISSVATGSLGVIVVVLESLQSLFQFQTNWISYRSTAEALKREKHLWQVKAGDYINSKNPDALLAERIEFLVSSETSKWAANIVKHGKQDNNDDK